MMRMAPDSSMRERPSLSLAFFIAQVLPGSMPYGLVDGVVWPGAPGTVVAGEPPPLGFAPGVPAGVGDFGGTGPILPGAGPCGSGVASIGLTSPGLIIMLGSG